MIRLFVAFAALIFMATPADAHERSRSNSSWTETETGFVSRFYLDARQATLFLALTEDRVSLETAFQDRLSDGLRVSRGGMSCDIESPPAVRLLADGRLEGRMNWTCSEAGAFSIDIQVFGPLSANHLHFIHFENLDGQDFEQLLARGRHDATFGTQGDDVLTGWVNFLRLGFEHILGGPDHVAFILGLMLLVAGWRRLAFVTLGFTLGHSITLAFAVLGWVSPTGAAIESLIGFSIIFVAAEAALKQRREFQAAGWIGGSVLVAFALLSIIGGGQLGWSIWAGLILLTGFYFHWLGRGGDGQGTAPMLSAGFGLIHGVGFAGILLEVELERAQILTSLLAFNVGVEFGQLAIIIVAMAALKMAARWVPGDVIRIGRIALIGALACVGTYWFLGRAFGA